MKNITHVAQLHRNRMALGLALALAGAGSVQAVEADPEGDAAASSRLETITVTAQRRPEDERKVPISLSTVSDDTLHAYSSGAEDIRYLSGRLPSLHIESSFGRAFPRFYVRGLGNTDFDLNASQPVSLVYDEIVQENPLLKGYPLFDMEQVELLRGPQGTLFGRNTPAGVVKFDSRRPSKEFDAYTNISYGRFGTTNFEGAVGGSLGGDWSARVAGMYQRRDDWVDNDFTHQRNSLEGFKEDAARAQFLYQPGGSFSALFNLHARSLDGTARLFRANILKPGTNDQTSDFDIGHVFIDGRNKQNLDGHGASAQLSWDFESTSLYSITGYEHVDSYSRGDIDGGYGASFAPPYGPGFIPFPSESADGLPHHRQLTQELRLQSNNWGRFDWQAGLYYFDEDISIDSFSYDTLGGGVENGYARQEQSNRAYAAYASGDYELQPDLTLRGGLRFTHDKKDFEAKRYISPIGGGASPLLTANPSKSNVSGDVSLTWAAQPDLNFYTRYARGFRAPSIQGRLLFGDSISVADAETVDSIEAGLKADLLDKRARLSFSVFDYTVHDQQLTAVGGAANFNQLINAKRSVGRGFEAEAQAYLTPDLLVTFATSYNNTRIHDKNLAIQPCGGGCTVLDPAGPVSGTVLIDGNRLPMAPEWVYDLTARYGWHFSSGELYFLTDWSYRGRVSFFLYDSKEFRGKPLVLGGVRVGYNWNSQQDEVALFGRNVTNRVTIVGGIDFDNLTGFVNEPRTWGLEYSHKF